MGLKEVFVGVEVRLPTVLRHYTGGEAAVRGEGDTVGAVLENLSVRFPGIRDQIVSEEGGIPRFVNVYLNDEDIRYLESLDTPTSEGDVISILPAVSGG